MNDINFEDLAKLAKENPCVAALALFVGGFIAVATIMNK